MDEANDDNGDNDNNDSGDFGFPGEVCIENPVGMEAAADSMAAAHTPTTEWWQAGLVESAQCVAWVELLEDEAVTAVQEEVVEQCVGCSATLGRQAKGWRMCTCRASSCIPCTAMPCRQCGRGWGAIGSAGSRRLSESHVGNVAQARVELSAEGERRSVVPLSTQTITCPARPERRRIERAPWGRLGGRHPCPITKEGETHHQARMQCAFVQWKRLWSAARRDRRTK